MRKLAALLRSLHNRTSTTVARIASNKLAKTNFSDKTEMACFLFHVAMLKRNVARPKPCGRLGRAVFLYKRKRISLIQSYAHMAKCA